MRDETRRFGPIEGDLIRVADSDLTLRVDENRQAVGDEPTLSYGGTIRTFNHGKPGPSELDVVLLGAVVAYPVIGIVMEFIGI
jgi:urease alpha subunit